MSAQDLEQRALLTQIRHLLASLPVDCLGSDTDASGQPYPIRDEVIHGITKLLAHQTAPVVDGEVRFNAAFFVNNAGNRIEQLTTYEDYRRDGAVLALMDLGQKRASAKKLTKKGGGRVVLAWVSAPQPVIADDDSFFAYQPAPEVDDTRMARALEWVRTAARGNVGEGDALRVALVESARKHLPAIEEAIAAYDPNCGARTVRVVDDGNGVRACSVLTAARAQGVQS